MSHSRQVMNPILGIDFGEARIGVAISDELRLLAHPVETISGERDAISRIVEIARAKKIEKVVVGVPRNMDGSFGAAAEKALQFVEKLREVANCPVATWDERLTSVAANRQMREAGRKTKKTRAYIDQVAAQIILQSYLDSQSRAATTEEMLR
jgi:putative holliday junction resolvase